MPNLSNTIPVQPENDNLDRLIKRHAEQWGKLNQLPDGDSSCTTLLHECEMLAIEIMMTPARTRKDLAVKRRIWELEDLDNAFVLELIAELDEQRIASR